MKKVLIMLMAAGLIAATVTAQETDTPFKSDSAKLSYSIGLNIATSLKAQGIDIDADALTKGLADGLGDGEPLITMDEARSTIQAFQQEMQAKQMAKMKEQAGENEKAGEAFLAENAKKDGVVVLPSGLQYQVMEPGDGPKPTASDTVKVNYRGTLIDGTEFDSSYKRNEPAVFGVDKVIPGWTEALQLMPVGAKWKLFIPAKLAYGERGTPGGPIPPNATLVFEVELLGIQ